MSMIIVSGTCRWVWSSSWGYLQTGVAIGDIYHPHESQDQDSYEQEEESDETSHQLIDAYFS